MKEIILHETRRLNGHIVLTALAGTTITVDNILGIINKTTGKVVYTPLKFGTISVGTVVLSDGTYQEIIFGQDVPEQPAGSQFFVKLYTDDAAGGYDEMVAQFFGLPQSLPSGYHAMTEAEVLEIADEVWDAMYGFVAVPNTVHTVDASESERVFTTYMNPTKTYADYGWPALWDADGVTIPLTDHPTANRVIYTFNPSND